MLRGNSSAQTDEDFTAFKMQTGTGQTYAYMIIAFTKKNVPTTLKFGTKADLDGMNEEEIAVQMMGDQIQIGMAPEDRSDGFTETLMAEFVQQKAMPCIGYCFYKDKLFCMRYCSDNLPNPRARMMFANLIESFCESHKGQLMHHATEEAEMDSIAVMEDKWQSANRI